MVRINWKVSALPHYLWTAIKWQWTKLQISRMSLFYNHYTNRAYVIDIMLGPMLWFVESFTKVLGPIFVMCVCFLTTAIVLIAHWIGIPFYWEKSPALTIFLIIFGYWILLNVVFHYYMAVTTLPGHPPEGILIPEAASMCKKCIAPKPPRTHHCTICNKCILKMDHHCPWLDNCVGHRNHRYFYMYMVYVFVGVIFLMAGGLEIAYREMWLEHEEELTGHPVRFNNSVMVEVDELPYDSDSEDDEFVPHGSMLQRSCIVFVSIICLSVFFALGGLSLWHGVLITQGKTSVEMYINMFEARRMKKIGLTFVNPYDFGWRRNWQLFLGLVDGRSWRHVLLPSTHGPAGDGLVWTTIYSHMDGQPHAPTEVTTYCNCDRNRDTPAPEPPVFHMMNVKKPTPTPDAGQGDVQAPIDQQGSVDS